MKISESLNRLISSKSSHRRGGLAPRCRLFASWGCSRSQGLGCSPIKAEHELGSKRRKLLATAQNDLREKIASYRGKLFFWGFQRAYRNQKVNPEGSREIF